MSKLEWGKVGERIYEDGVDRGVLYPRVGPGVAWTGLVGVTEKSDGGEITPYYYDGVKYFDYVAGEDFAATIEAYAAPPEFAACEGTRQLVPGLFATQQPRQTFGLSYRTLIGNDLQGMDYGYKLHLVYGCTAATADRSNSTLAGTPSPSTRTWDISTVPQPASTYKPTAHFVFDTRYMDRALIENVESYLYGRDDTDPRLPSQAEILAIVANVIREPLTATI